MLLAERCESERLRQIIKELQRHRFGRRAETLPEDQMLLGLEDVEQVAAYGEAQDVSAPEGRDARTRKRRGNRGALPAHLPRIEVIVDIEDKTCPCCQGELHRIDEDRSERLDLVPAQFRILATRRPKYRVLRRLAKFVGVKEGSEVIFQLATGLVVLDGRLLKRAVHSLDLAVSPRVIGFGRAMFDAMS
ncbi:hypothetical protein ACVIHI_008400 [Bradyrhizobium sp. USDA 4524]|nr:hypothetical protein [Bradyrhizobium sp. USDA 4538]MCP1899238.1 hypothetical protein [Bradyrhizobium sp. USDA 4537]MCP1986650.1 hypothetical protein [Bradyrhizobium sp. USDA 4539]